MKLLLIMCLASTLMLVNSDLIHREKRSFSGGVARVLKITDKLYVAIGYALGNVIMVIAPEGLIIIDTTESMVAARQIKDEFRKYSTAPIKAIIYTHHHADHIGGAKVFVEDTKNPPDVWAHHLLVSENEAYFTYAVKARFQRAMRQFGVFTQNSSNTVEFGTEDDEYGTVYPNRLVYQEEENVTIAGLPVTIGHIEGETLDQIGVWIPSMEAFMPGDTFYTSFPNTYTVRGAPVRNPVAWYKSLDYIISKQPEHLVPSHGKPFLGKATIRNAMIPYRDGVQYMHDQAVRYINQGLTPDEVARRVKFPDSLKDVEALREEYGRVDWSVKGVFQLYLGWFSGSPQDLLPLPFSERAKELAELVGGASVLSERAKRAADTNKTQWALELASYALEVDSNDTQARAIKVKALNDLADTQINTIAQNYLRTSALDTSGELDLLNSKNAALIDSVDNLDIHYVFDVLPLAFKPEVCGNSNMSLNVHFCDSDKKFSVRVRNSVVIVTKDQPIQNATLSFVTTENAFRRLIKGRIGLPESARFLEVTGKPTEIGFLKTCFDGL